MDVVSACVKKRSTLYCEVTKVRKEAHEAGMCHSNTSWDLYRAITVQSTVPSPCVALPTSPKEKRGGVSIHAGYSVALLKQFGQ